MMIKHNQNWRKYQTKKMMQTKAKQAIILQASLVQPKVLQASIVIQLVTVNSKTCLKRSSMLCFLLVRKNTSIQKLAFFASTSTQDSEDFS